MVSASGVGLDHKGMAPHQSFRENSLEQIEQSSINNVSALISRFPPVVNTYGTVCFSQVRKKLQECFNRDDTFTFM